MARREEEVVAGVAHDLQVPLQAVRMAVDALAADPALPGETRERLLRVAADGIDEIGRLVEDLLDGARLDAGAVEAALAPCDVMAVAEAAAETAALAAGRETPPVGGASGLYALADAGLLRRVLLNLLANAFAHGGPGVSVSVAGEGGRVTVAVADDGEGILPQDRERVFERFARLPGGSARGTGLGLAIARELAVAMGGSLSVGEGAAAGAVFTLSLAAVSPPGPGR